MEHLARHELSLSRGPRARKKPVAVPSGM